ncbi:hypothetical protein V1477_017639, partial [Vespula maculifrons]
MSVGRTPLKGIPYLTFKFESKIHCVWWQRKRKGCENSTSWEFPCLTFRSSPSGKRTENESRGSFVRVQENRSVLSRWLLESEACSIDSLMLPAGGCDSDVGMRLARTLIELSQIIRIRKVCPECDQIRDPAIVGFWNLLWYSLDVLLVYSPGRLYGEVGGWGNDRSVSLCKEDSERAERDKEIEK